MREWVNINVTVEMLIPDDGSIFNPCTCGDVPGLGARVDQMWRNRIVLCVCFDEQDSSFNISVGGPLLSGVAPPMCAPAPSILAADHDADPTGTKPATPLR